MLAVAAIWLASVLRWYVDDSVVPWDSKNQFYAFFRFLAESLHAGTSIFWNPYHYGGHPSIADPQSLIFSPPFFLWALVDRTPSLRTFDLIVYLHLLAGGMAMAGIGMRRPWPASASVLAAVVFMLGGAASARLNHTGIIICYALFPVALLTLELALERRSIAMALAFTVTAAMIVLGRNQVALMLSLLLAAMGLRQIAVAPAPIRFLRERLPILALILLAGIALTGIPILLSLQLAALSNRPEVPLVEALDASLHPVNFATALVANVFGSHSPAFGYWGPHYTITPDVAATDASFNYLFVGAVPTILVLWLGVAGGRLGQRGVRSLALILAGALLFALGRYSPLFPFVFDHVPGFSYFRRPVDGAFVLTVMLALLSGHLLSGYVRDGLPGIRPLPLALLISAVLALAIGVGGIVALSDRQHDTLIGVGQALLPVGLVLGLLWMCRGTGRRGFAAACITVVGAAELVFWNAASRLNAEHSRNYEVLESTSAEDAEALRLLGSEIERRHSEGARPRVEIVGLSGPWQNLSVIRKIESTTGYNPLRIGIYDRYVSPGETGWLANARRFPASFDGYDCAIARALGLEYVVLDRPIEQLTQMLRPTRFETLLAGPRVWIYRLPGAMPRAMFSSRIRVADLDATWSTGELVYPPQHDQIAIDADTPPSAAARLATLAAGTSTASIISWRPGEIVVDVDAASSGVLVLHDTYYPGWTARVDGAAVPILRAEVLFRGVEVPAGRHTVVFRFEPLRPANLWAALGDVGRRREVEAPSREPD